MNKENAQGKGNKVVATQVEEKNVMITRKWIIEQGIDADSVLGLTHKLVVNVPKSMVLDEKEFEKQIQDCLPDYELNVWEEESETDYRFVFDLFDISSLTEYINTVVKEVFDQEDLWVEASGRTYFDLPYDIFGSIKTINDAIRYAIISAVKYHSNGYEDWRVATIECVPNFHNELVTRVYVVNY